MGRGEGMKIKRCSLDLAHALVEGWKADANLERVSKDVWGEDYQSFRQIRALMPEWNKMANNALWDGNFNTAINYLLKHGLASNEAVRPSQEAEIQKARRNYRQNIGTFEILKDAQRYKNETISRAGIRNKLRRR
jgi:hypothetical protein